eukprot:sb/3463255/
MFVILLFLCLLGSSSGFHITAPRTEPKDQSTVIDFLRTTNKTIDALLKGELLNTKCLGCEVFVEVLQVLVQQNVSKTEIASLIRDACIYLHIEDKRVCSFIVQQFRDEFITVAAKLLLHPAWLCYAAIGPECGEPADLFPMWNVTIPGDKPPREPLVRPKDGYPTLRVVQLSDVHVDLQYTYKGVIDCGEPLCCREGKGQYAGDQAGYWGSLKASCDIPLRTYKNALKFIAEEIKPDLVFWTGDIPAHDVWNQSRSEQQHHIGLTAQLMREYLPRTRVYPALGNHESSPVDSFPPPGLTSKALSNDWLNLYVQKIWSLWLPPEALPTVGYAGYYAVQHSESLRIVSLNTMYCDALNFWLYLDNTDPGGQLQWLVQELTWAEKARIKVIILGHIPTGRIDCLKSFSWNYYRIVDRFEGTIVGQFMGHTHLDHFMMQYSEEPDHHSTSYQFVSPSLTTFADLRPSIRVYTFDGLYSGSTYRPLKHETYLFDLDRANTKNETVWELEYDTESAYNLTWLVPDEMESLVTRLEEDRGFFNKTYYNFMYHKNGNKCDDDCYQYELCQLRTGRSHDPSICPAMSLEERRKRELKYKMC